MKIAQLKSPIYKKKKRLQRDLSGESVHRLDNSILRQITNLTQVKKHLNNEIEAKNCLYLETSFPMTFWGNTLLLDEDSCKVRLCRLNRQRACHFALIPKVLSK